MPDLRARLAEAVREGIVSPDRFRTDEQGHYHVDEDEDAIRRMCVTAWRTAMRRRPVEAVLLCGAPASGKTTWLQQHRRRDTLYYDGTCGQPGMRALLCQIARERGIEPRIVWLNTPLHECLERNARRMRKTPEDMVRRIHRAIASRPPHEAHVDLYPPPSAR